MKKFTTIIFISFFAVLSYFLIERITRSNFSTQLSDDITTNNSIISPKESFKNNFALIKAKYYDPKLNGQDFNKWKKYEKYIKTQDDVYIAINSILASLNDPYSRFLSKEEYKSQNENIDSRIFGIGVNIAPISGKMVVVNVVEKTPAFKAGVKAKDVILSINGKKVSGQSVHDVAQMIRGPIDSKVHMEFLRNGKTVSKNILRDEIKIETVQSKIIDKNIGYIQISSFISSQMPTELIGALEKIKDTDSTIIDLRGNAGGLLPNAIFAANLFMKNGNIVSIVDRKGTVNRFKAQKDAYINSKPLIVLIDGASASASEILSGALKDQRRGILVGEKTFGKGVVQKIYPVENECGLNLTIAKYLTPNGTDINHVGISPNHKVAFDPKSFTKGHDTQLEYALKLLKNELAKK